MEVAMMKINRRSLGLLIAAACLSAGCAEPLTFSHDFKRNGIAQYNGGEYIDATGSFKAAARQDPTDYQTQYYLGITSEKTGEFHSAVEAYRLCLKLQTQTPAGRMDVPMRERVLSHLAAVIARSDDPTPEMNAIQAEAAGEQSSLDYRLLARIYALRGDADSAVDSYRRAFAIADGDSILTREYAFYLLKIDQVAEGTRVLKIAWRLDPSDKQVARAMVELGIKDSDIEVSSTRLENEPVPASATPASAWDTETAPKD
jgi:tetratricopeptide (TPR) repeat protein